MSARTTTSSALLAAMLIGFTGLGSQREVAAQRPQADLRIIRAVDVSSDTLQVTVEYMYRGELSPGGVRLWATAEEEGGVFDPKIVKWDEVPVRPGVFTHTLTITKLPDAPDFVSVAVSVCLSTMDSAIVCRNLPHRKQWTTAAPPSQPLPPAPTPVPTPPPQPVPQMCSISGFVQGRLVQVLGPDHPGGVSESIELRHIVATRPDGTKIRARIEHRRFVFTSLPAGVVYRLSPGAIFRSNPASITVRCMTGVRHNADFRIL
jgi:hypothetical protein